MQIFTSYKLVHVKRNQDYLWQKEQSPNFDARTILTHISFGRKNANNPNSDSYIYMFCNTIGSALFRKLYCQIWYQNVQNNVL